MVKTRIFDIATAWSLEEILDHYLPEELSLMGGYIDARYREVRITVTVEAIGKPHILVPSEKK